MIATANRMIASANEELKQAAEELNRPVEDIACASVCQCTRKAIYKFLLGYVHFIREKSGSHISVPGENMSFRDLIMECNKTDDSFEHIPVYPLLCSWSLADNKDVFCFSYYKVKECYDLAESLRDYIISRINVKNNHQ